MKKVLILTAGFGEGHNAAARNLAAAIEASAGPGSAHVVDLFALASPRLNRVSRRGYLALINRAPRVWSRFYGWIDRRDIFPRHLWFLRRELGAFAECLRREQPMAVCSAYPVYGFLANRLAAGGGLRVPYYHVVTDSISINTLWTKPACAGWFVPNEETAGVMRRMGVPPEKLHAYGFPVQAFFAEHEGRLSPPDLAAGARPRVLFIVHSGVRHAETTARRLLAETDWELTIAVGRDEGLRRRLAHAASGRRVSTTLLGWTDQVPRLLMTHHVVISKAGGATTQEAIAAHCPMVVNQIVPGQEEGNFELLRRRDAGALAETPDAVLDALRRAFADGGARCRHWSESMRTLARRDAAPRIAAHVLCGQPITPAEVPEPAAMFSQSPSFHG